MKQEKDSMIRLTPEMGAMIDALIPLVEQVAELKARLEYGGKVTRSGLIRELIRLGMPHLRRLLPEVVAPVASPVAKKPSPKPTKKPAAKAKKKARK